MLAVVAVIVLLLGIGIFSVGLLSCTHIAGVLRRIIKIKITDQRRADGDVAPLRKIILNCCI